MVNENSNAIRQVRIHSVCVRAGYRSRQRDRTFGRPMNANEQPNIFYAVYQGWHLQLKTH